MSLLEWGVAIIMYFWVAGVFYFVFRHRAGEHVEGFIVFTNPQTLVLGLIWPITVVAFFVLAIAFRIPKRPAEGLQYELVDLNNRRDRKFTVSHHEYGTVEVWYTPCTYRQWWKRKLPGPKRRGHRVSYGHQSPLLKDPQHDPFVGRIVPIEDHQAFRDFMVREVKRLMCLYHKE